MTNVFFFSAKVTYLFDNGGTVFFAIFMAIWGKYVLLCALSPHFLSLLLDLCPFISIGSCVNAHTQLHKQTFSTNKWKSRVSSLFHVLILLNILSPRKFCLDL